MATPSTNNAAVLPGNLRFSSGGLPVSDLTGAFVKSVDTAGLVTVQLADGSEDTVQIVTGGDATAEKEIFVASASTYASGLLSLTVTGTPGTNDIIIFQTTAALGSGSTDLNIRMASVTRELHDRSTTRLTSGDLAASTWYIGVIGNTVRLLSSVSDAMGGASLTDAAIATSNPQSESTTDGASRQAIAEALSSLGVEIGTVGPYHYRINQSATQTDNQAAHFLGGIYQNTSDRPIRVREAFMPVHPDGSGTTEYAFYVWKVDRASGTSYMTDIAADASDQMRTAATGTNIGHDATRGEETELHGYTRTEVIIDPDEYFAVAVNRNTGGTNANTIVASGSDVSQDYDGAITYVAKASFSGTFSTDPVEVYHNSSFAEKTRLIFTFEDGGALPPIHGIHRKETPEGADRIAFSDEGEAANPNAYVEWADVVDLIRNVSVYDRTRPQASADRLYDVVISAINRSGDICLDVPVRTTAATGTWAAITPGTAIEYARVRSGVTSPVEGRYYYEYFTDEFWFGADVGGSNVQLIQDDADDALASFLSTGADTVVWLHHHATDDAALLALQTLETGHEAFYWNTTDLEIRKLSSYVPPGVPVVGHHYQWVRLFGGPGGESDDASSDGGSVEELFSNLDTDGVTINIESGFGNTAANNGEFEFSRALVEADDNDLLLIDIEYTTGPTSTRVTHYLNHYISARSFRERDAVAAGASNSDNTESIYVHRFGNSPALTGWAEGRFIFGRGRNTTSGNDIMRVAAGANSTSPDITAVKVRILLVSTGAAASASEADTAPARNLVARSVISSGVHLGLSDPDDVSVTSGNDWLFNPYSNAGVPIADVLDFVGTVRIAGGSGIPGRSGIPFSFTKEQMDYAQNHNVAAWNFFGTGVGDGALIPCFYVKGLHNTGGVILSGLRPTRQQVGWDIGALNNGDLSFIILLFVRWDASDENIVGVNAVAISDEDCEVEQMHIRFFEDA